MSQHERIGGENGSRSGRRSINGKEGVDCGELSVDFFFLNVEEMSDMLNHLLMGESHLVAGRAVRRRGGDNIRGVTNTVGRGHGAGRDEDGGRGTRHCWAVMWCVEGKKQV